MSQSSSQAPASDVLVVLPSDKVVIVEQIIPSTPERIQQKLLGNVAPVAAVEAAPEPATPPFDLRQWVSDLRLNQSLACARETWARSDSDIAFMITNFKREYILPIGDIPVRSVCMAVSTAVTYAVLGRWNQSLLGRSRNLVLNFVANGSFWLPELFNPFLFASGRV